ncbi:hypothetical protein L3X38_042486 [Prunus dulcis]|uniref:Uncharacterized protein n=1 Tax=Prunus dulcis TaxID=3755 RepID=A0AAD4YKC7_PRUDU|nr:hypothetical protein L3X38_042486 [Prunus dulcis]
MIDFTGVEGVHSGDNGTEMNGLQMRSAPPILAHLETFSQVGVVGFGTTSELSIRHNWRQMGEQNVHNLGIVNDEEKILKARIHGIIEIQIGSPCPWRLRASSYEEKNFMIVKYNPVHECDMSFIQDKHRHASAKLIGNAVKRKLKDSRTIYTPSDKSEM